MEIGDWQRLSGATIGSYLGLVPSEHSSGESIRRGGITKSGNGHARRILVESAWSYRYRPTMSYEIRRRNRELSASVQASAWKAQQRLNARYKKLVGRGKPKQQVVTALARELAGFVWHIGRQPELQAA